MTNSDNQKAELRRSIDELFEFTDDQLKELAELARYERFLEWRRRKKASEVEREKKG